MIFLDDELSKLKEDSVFEKQLKEIFKPADKKEQSTFFSVLSLVLLHNSKLSELHDAYSLLGMDDFVRLINLFDGRTVRFPQSAELRNAVIFSLCFYYKEVENKSWDVIHSLIPYNFNSIAMAYKIKSLNSALRSELKDLFSKGENNDTTGTSK